MRFSIRWLLVVMAYVALLAAAVGTRSEVLVDCVWGVTILAMCFAIVVAAIDRGKRRAMAIGFVCVAASHLLVSVLRPESAPETWMYRTAGYTADRGTIFEPTGVVPGTRDARGMPVPVVRHAVGLVPSFRMSSAVVTLVAGLVGCWIGLFAYEHRGDSDERP